MSFSDYTDNALLGWVKGTDMPTAPAALFVALFDGDPGKDGAGGTEVTATIRSGGRVETTFGAIADGAITNDAVADFEVSEGDADVNFFAIYDDADAGNLIGSGALTDAQSVVAGKAVSFGIGDLTISQG